MGNLVKQKRILFQPCFKAVPTFAGLQVEVFCCGCVHQLTAEFQRPFGTWKPLGKQLWTLPRVGNGLLANRVCFCGPFLLCNGIMLIQPFPEACRLVMLVTTLGAREGEDHFFVSCTTTINFNAKSAVQKYIQKCLQNVFI